MIYLICVHKNSLFRPVELLVIGEYRSINSVFEIDNHDCFNSDVLLLFLDVL